MKNIILSIVALLILGIGGFFGYQYFSSMKGSPFPDNGPLITQPEKTTQSFGLPTPYDPATITSLTYDPKTPVVGRYAKPGVSLVSIIDDYAYIVDDHSGFRILDISDPKLPTPVGYVKVDSTVDSILLFGNRAYVGIGGLPYKPDFRIYDINDRTTPKEIGRFQGDKNFGLLTVGPSYVHGNTLFLLDTPILHVLDISNPASPTEIAQYTHPDPSTNMREMAMVGEYLYIASGMPGVLILDVSNPRNPNYKGAYDTKGYPEGVVARGNKLYVADKEGLGLTILDVTKQEVPKVLATEYTEDRPFIGMDAGVLVGETAFMRSSGGVSKYDISGDKIQDLKQGAGFPGYTWGVAVHNGYTYLANDQNGLIVLKL